MTALNFRRRLGSIRRHPWRTLFTLVLVAFLAMNIVAFVQAWAMTHFVAGGFKTASPERLSKFQKVQILLTGIRVPRPVNLGDPSTAGLAFSTRHVTSGGNDLEIWTIPDTTGRHRAMVVMYHGYASSKSSLIKAAVQFHETGCDVEMVDFPGSGGLAGNTTTIGYREADDVIATTNDARSHLLRPSEPVVLFGQSLGAAAVLRAVGDLQLRADGLLLESPYDRLLATAENRFRSMGLPPFPFAHLLVFWGGIENGYWAFGLNPADSAAGVHIPAIIFQGGLDRRVTNDQARAVYDGLAGRKQFELYPTANHCGFRADDPARWRKTVDGFVGSLVTP